MAGKGRLEDVVKQIKRLERRERRLTRREKRRERKEQRLQSWQTIPLWLRWSLFFSSSFMMGFYIMEAIGYISTGSPESFQQWANKYTGAYVLTIIICTALVALLGTILGRLWLSGTILSATALGMALTDYFKIQVNGVPLTLEDFGLAGQAGQVAELAGDLQIPDIFWAALFRLLICIIALFFLQPYTYAQTRGRFLEFSGTVMLALFLFSGCFSSNISESFQVDIVTRLDPSSSHNTYGLTVSLWRDLLLQKKEPPENYSESYMKDILTKIDERFAAQPKKLHVTKRITTKHSIIPPTKAPNVMVILSESFFDVTRLPNVEYDRDPVKNYHALQREGISGHFFTHYLGYGTGYVEMSLQTGLTPPDLGAATNICFMDEGIYDLVDALAEQYTNTGNYRAEMFHAYDDSLYNRKVTYPHLGYSQSYYSKDIQEMGAEGEIYSGYYMSDSYFYRNMRRRMEAINQDGERAFLFGITMENHQPFNPDKYKGVCQVDVKTDRLADDEMAIFKAGLEGIIRADQALGAMIDILRDYPEPTIVAVFGDHRPTLSMPDGETLYTKLGQSPGNDTTIWTAEELGEVYSSDYLIWANDAAIFEGKAGTVQSSGILSFGAQILRLTGNLPSGKPISRYWEVLKWVSQVELVNTPLYFANGEGKVYASRDYAGMTEEENELLDMREYIVYDAIYGKRYITKEMNRPPGS